MDLIVIEQAYKAINRVYQEEALINDFANEYDLVAPMDAPENMPAGSTKELGDFSISRFFFRDC